MMESQESDLPLDDAMLDWQIERYVLGDSDVGSDWDCEAFETRLEQDPGLAERVAAAVDDLILLKRAAKALPLYSELSEVGGVTGVPRRSQALESSSTDVRIWRTLAALAAMMLVGVGIAWGIAEFASDPLRTEASASEISQVAASWVALNPVSLEVEADAITEDWGLEEDNLFGTELGGDFEDSDDWLYLGGQEYFLHTSMTDYKAES